MSAQNVPAFRPDTPTDAMLHRIDRMLDRIEAENHVQILYACESGSRAWGMASSDSDCDVRFIYVRPREEYLCVLPEKEPDVIECGLVETPDGVLDCSGWDLRKTLRLFLGSNASLLDWLASPIIYRCNGQCAPVLREMADRVISRMKLWHHYRSLRDKTLRSFASRRTAKLWLYAFRAQLAMLWLEQGRGLPPSAIGELCMILPGDMGLQKELASAIADKREGREADGGFAPPVGLDEILQEAQARMKAYEDAGCYAMSIPALVQNFSGVFTEAVRREVDATFRKLLRFHQGNG